jgi:hypothetical protein
LLYKEGIYIGKRRTYNRTVLLYQLESFYAEIFYKSYRRYVDHIHCFETTAEIDPYLEDIDVADLAY